MAPLSQHTLLSCPHSILTRDLQDQEQEFVSQLQSLMPTYRARPSLLGPVASAAGFALGAAAGVLPSKLAHAITGKVSASIMHMSTVQHCGSNAWPRLPMQGTGSPVMLNSVANPTVQVRSPLGPSNFENMNLLRFSVNAAQQQLAVRDRQGNLD